MDLTTITVNAGPARLAKFAGREYLVAPLTMIVPGVLAGSRGPLLYPPEEISRDVPAWNSVPITFNHPMVGGMPVSASHPSVAKLGFVWNARYADRLVAEGWFDIEVCNRVDTRIVQWLKQGKPFELSTGLYTSNEVRRGSYEGRPYVAIARNYKPDHLAILLDQIGACSLADGCGVFNEALIYNVFCATGEGGGVDSSCGKEGGGEGGGDAPKGLAAKVWSGVKAKFGKMKDRYGTAGAVAVMAGVLAPVPGSAPVAIGIAEGVRGLVKAFTRNAELEVEPLVGEAVELLKELGLGEYVDRDKIRAAIQEELTGNAHVGQPRSAVTGFWKRMGSGTGAGDVHEAAQAGAVALTDYDLQLGREAAAAEGKPDWAADAAKWQKAVDSADEGDWAVVAHIYLRLGGAVDASAGTDGGAAAELEVAEGACCASCAAGEMCGVRS